MPWISAIAPPAAGQGVAGGRSHSASPHAPIGRAGYHFHLTFTNYRLQSPASSLSVHSATASHSQHTSQYRIHILSSNTGHIAVRSQHLSDVCVCRCCCWRRYELQAGVVLLPSALLSSPGRCCAAVGFPGRMDPRGMKTRHVPMAHEST